ncbi:hypothetical protein ACIBCT_15845 [Streptosporangium sp. NPDC050855]|uniref:hypothetical protein n=1 Tax=Streptosporangium sp. NPDC050855 TaxID=3366194 RepID=UPI00379ADD89
MDEVRKAIAAELVDQLTQNANHPWKPPGDGYEVTLTHEIVHGLDITVPLGIDRRVPGERLRMILPGFTPEKSRKHFGVDLDGIELRAEDLDWTLGSGTPLYGAAQDFTLVMCGRRLPAGRLGGEPAARFTAA